MLKKIVFITLFLLLLSTPSLLAQKKGISVTPSIIHLDLAVDPAEYTLTYQNNTNADITLSLSLSDFNELEESYKINFLEEKDAKNYKYSLSSWVTFENNRLQLSPNESKSVKVFIDKDRITKGGHYASILAELEQNEDEKKVQIRGVLSSLLFVRASTGKEIEDGKIRSLRPQRDGIEHPDTFILRFENNGNVHVVPYGYIEIFDPFGNKVTKGIFNENSLDALPESIRRYDIKVNPYQKILIPGFYNAKVYIHLGKTNKEIFSNVSFFSQGSFDFAKIGLILILIFITSAYYIRKKREKRD